jgi:hypothetical protein
MKSVNTPALHFTMALSEDMVQLNPLVFLTIFHTKIAIWREKNIFRHETDASLVCGLA